MGWSGADRSPATLRLLAACRHPCACRRKPAYCTVPCSVTTTVTQLYSRPEWVVSMRAMAGLLAHGGHAMALVPTQGQPWLAAGAVRF